MGASKPVTKGLLALAIVLAFGVRAALAVKPSPAPAPADPAVAVQAPAGPSAPSLPLWLRRVIRGLAAIAGVVVGLILLMLPFENRFIYYPSRYPAGDWRPKGIAFTDCAIATADGLEVHGWWVPGPAPGEGPVLLCFHGNAGNIADRARVLALFRKQGLGVLMIDYRGYGKSQGHPSEKGLYLDAEAAYRHLTEELRVPPQRIVCFGESLGCAVALHVALERPVGGVVLQSPFASARAMAQRMLPVIPLWPFIRSRFDNVGRIPGLKAPVLIMHGDCDEIVPFKQGLAVFEAAPQPKELYVIGGAGHNDVYDVGGNAYFAKLASFCRRCAEGGPRQ